MIGKPCQSPPPRLANPLAIFLDPGIVIRLIPLPYRYTVLNTDSRLLLVTGIGLEELGAWSGRPPASPDEPDGIKEVKSEKYPP